MEIKPQVVVVQDANIWISYLIGTKFGSLIDALDNPNFKFITCFELIDELKNVTKREKFRKWFTEEAANAIIKVIEEKCTLIPIKNIRQPLVRDPKDQYIINLAIQGNANLVVSNDDDIKVLKDKFTDFKIMTLAEFMEYYNEFEKKSALALKIENNLNNTFTNKPFTVIDISVTNEDDKTYIDKISFSNGSGKIFNWSTKENTLDKEGNHHMKNYIFNIHSSKLIPIKEIEQDNGMSL